MTDIYTLAPQIIKAIQVIEVPYDDYLGYSKITEQDARDIANLFPPGRAGMDVFIELDERPGQFQHDYRRGNWHWKLRQARNDYDYLFDRFNQEG